MAIFQGDYDAVNAKLRRYSIESAVFSFVDFVSRTADVTYLEAHKLIPLMSEEEFERVVARYKLETSE